MKRDEVNQALRRLESLTAFEAVQHRFWFATGDRVGSMIDYEFYDMGEVVQYGSCTDDEMIERFDRLTKSSLH